MPYIARSVRRRAKWMTLTEATHYIREKESCESQLALHQLFLAIVDGEVRVKRGLVDPESTLGMVSPSKFRGDLKICLDGEGSVKIDRNSKKSCYPNIAIVNASDFCSDDDTARDDTAGEDPLDYDPLWLRRSDVTRLWSGEARSVKSRKQRVSERAILEAARKVYKEHADKPPNLREAEKFIREELPGATRKQMEPILQKPEFADLRLPRGRHPKV